MLLSSCKYVTHRINCGKGPVKIKRQVFHYVYVQVAAVWWRSWLKHCATSPKVAGSIPDGVIGIFH